MHHWLRLLGFRSPLAAVMLSVWIIPRIPLRAESPSLNWSALSVAVSSAYRKGDLNHAEQILRSALSSVSSATGTESVVFRNQLGRVLEDLSRLDEAEQQYRQVIEINKTAAGPLELETASALNNLASI